MKHEGSPTELPKLPDRTVQGAMERIDRHLGILDMRKNISERMRGATAESMATNYPSRYEVLYLDEFDAIKSKTEITHRLITSRPAEMEYLGRLSLCSIILLPGVEVSTERGVEMLALRKTYTKRPTEFTEGEAVTYDSNVDLVRSRYDSPYKIYLAKDVLLSTWGSNQPVQIKGIDEPTYEQILDLKTIVDGVIQASQQL